MSDIRNIPGLWCDDITFCQEKCGWTDCPRNSQNIRDRTIPHSFSVEIPEDCPKQNARKNKAISSALEAVVYCRDCKHVCMCITTDIFPDMPVYAKCTLTDEVHEPDWFCADGEMRGEDDEHVNN